MYKLGGCIICGQATKGGLLAMPAKLMASFAQAVIMHPSIQTIVKYQSSDEKSTESLVLGSTNAVKEFRPL